jgi:hypothetical protein
VDDVDGSLGALAVGVRDEDDLALLVHRWLLPAGRVMILRGIPPQDGNPNSAVSVDVDLEAADHVTGLVPRTLLPSEAGAEPDRDPRLPGLSQLTEARCPPPMGVTSIA